MGCDGAGRSESVTFCTVRVIDQFAVSSFSLKPPSVLSRCRNRQCSRRRTFVPVAEASVGSQPSVGTSLAPSRTFAYCQPCSSVWPPTTPHFHSPIQIHSPSDSYLKGSEKTAKSQRKTVKRKWEDQGKAVSYGSMSRSGRVASSPSLRQNPCMRLGFFHDPNHV